MKSFTLRFATILAGSGGLLVTAPLAASPEDNLDDWLKARYEHFSVLSAANHNQPALIAVIKAKTAAMIAAYRPLASADDGAPVIWRATSAPLVIFDDAVAPRMVLVPAGEFSMGIGGAAGVGKPGSMRRVRIGTPFAVSMFPIVYGEFAQFAVATHYQQRGPCVTFEQGSFASRADRDWRNPGFAETPRSPAACIGFEGATAYAAWLSRKTGHQYRLLSEAEYEYVTRAGTTTTYSWGDDPTLACTYANGFDQDAKPYAGSPTPLGCHDKNAAISPVGIFKPNAFGLFDTAGDVASWTTDCWNDSIARTPANGAPRNQGDCSRRVLRGGSWADTNLAAASRTAASIDHATAYEGFRLARIL